MFPGVRSLRDNPKTALSLSAAAPQATMRQGLEVRYWDWRLLPFQEPFRLLPVDGAGEIFHPRMQKINAIRPTG